MSETPLSIVKQIAKQGRQYVMIIPKEYLDSGRLELGFYYEVTFRRLKKVEKSAGEGKNEKLKSTSSPGEKIGMSNLPTKSKEIDWTRIKPAGRRERRST